MNLVGGKFIRSLAKVRDNEGKLVMRSGQLAYLVEHGFVEQVEGVISNSREWGYYRLTDKGAQALVGDFHQPNKGQDYARLRSRVQRQRREIKRLHRDRANRVSGGGERVAGDGWRSPRFHPDQIGAIFAQELGSEPQRVCFGGGRRYGMSGVKTAQMLANSLASGHVTTFISVDELNRRLSRNPVIADPPEIIVDEAAVVEWDQGLAELIRVERSQVRSGTGQRKFRLEPGHYARMVGIDLASGPDRSFLTTMGQDGVESVEIVDGVVPDVGQVGQVGPVYPSECACSCEPVALPPITREEILGGWQWRNDRGEWQAESIAAWIREFFETGKPTLKMPDMESTHALEYWLNLAAKEAVAAALEIDPFPAEDAFSGHVRQGFKAAQSMEPWSKCLTLVIASMLRASVVLRRGETRR